MKKQKNRRRWGMVLLSVLLLTGCSSAGETAGEMTGSSAEGYVSAAQQALTEADSFAASFEAKVEMQGGSATETEGAVLMVQTPYFAKIDTTMTFDHTTQTYAVYLEEQEDSVNQYMNYDGQWTEMTMTKENAQSSMQIYHTQKNIETLLAAITDWDAAEKGEIVTLTGTIPEEKVFSVEESCRFFQLAGMSGLSEVYFSGVGAVPVKLEIDRRTGAPLSYEVQLSDALEIVTNNVLRELGGGTLEEEISVGTYTICSALTRLGGVAAEEIPEGARNMAINYEKEISLLEDTE